MFSLTSTRYAEEVSAILSEHINNDTASVVVGLLLRGNEDFYASLKEYVSDEHPHVCGRVWVSFSIHRDNQQPSTVSVSDNARYHRTVFDSRALAIANKYNLPDGDTHLRCRVTAHGKIYED
jgi:hypothetical protein